MMRKIVSDFLCGHLSDCVTSLVEKRKEEEEPLSGKRKTDFVGRDGEVGRKLAEQSRLAAQTCPGLDGSFFWLGVERTFLP